VDTLFRSPVHRYALVALDLSFAAMAITKTAFAIFVACFSYSAVDAVQISGATSNDKPNKKSHKRGAQQKLVKLQPPEVSAKMQACFSPLKFGISPGSTLGQTTEKSVNACMARCVKLEDCYAMSFRMSDGLCNAINRTYEVRFEASDERVLANRLSGCKHDYGTAKGDELPTKQAFNQAQVKLPEVSLEAQRCFTNLTFGASPGSTLGQTTEKSVDDCMLRCADLEDCYAMSFRMSDGLCNAINRTYEARFEASDERVLANKLAGCNQAYGTPKGSKIKEDAANMHSKASSLGLAGVRAALLVMLSAIVGHRFS